jgi:hypothetical protein
MANVVVSALATWNGRALKKGKQDISSFDKSVKALGRTFGVTFSAAALVNFSKKAINAFARDEAAAKSLAIQLENTGNAFKVTEVEDYIASLQRLYGILDDELRPAFQTLLNATGSVTLSQQALQTAINVSAGTGKDLASVVAAIAKGATGTTTALQRLGTGLDKTTIASGDMNKIMAALDKKFAGQAIARLDTYAGKMNLIKVAAADATEIIGKGLVDALTILSKDNSIANLSDDFKNMAENIALVIVNLAKLTDKIASVVNNPSFKPALLLLAVASKNPKAIAGAFAYVGGTGALEVASKNYSTAPSSPFTYGSGNPRADLILQKKLTTAKKDEYNIITASNKARSEIDKLKDKFDLERIGLMVALNQATDEETKLRIRAQLAILDNNEALAKKYNAELNAKTATDLLASAAYQAAAALTNFGPALFDALGNMTGRGKNQIAPFENYTYTVPQGATNQQAQTATGGTPTVGVTVNAGTIITDQQLEAVIQKNVLQLLKSGNKLLPAGSLTN